MATDAFGNKAEQGASSRLANFMAKVTGQGITDVATPENQSAVATMAADELKTMAASDKGSAIVSEVDGWFSRTKAARMLYEHVWLKCLDMGQGRQFTDWDPTQKKMRQQPAPDFEPRVVVNVIEPVMRTALAKTGSTHPTATVLPASNDDQDIMVARAAEQLWEWQYNTSKFQSKVFNLANFWASYTGNGFVKTFYDESTEDEAATAAAQVTTTKSDDILAQDSFSDMFSAPGQAATPTKAKPVLGKIRHAPVSPFHLYVPDLAEPDIQQQPYVIHAYPVNRNKAKQIYGKFVDDEKWMPAAQTADTIISAYELGMPGGNTAVPDTVIVQETWIKPGTSLNLPNGGVVVTIGGTLVGMSDGMPYDHKEYPFAHLGVIETGTFYRKSVIVTMIPLQNELNRTYAQIVKHRNIALKPMMFYDAGSLDPKRIQSKAGTYIPVALGANRPTQVPMQDLSQAFWNLIDKVKQELDNITGQHDVSRSTSPGADTAASAISVLQEADNNFLYSWFDSIESAVEQSARHFLSNAAQFWDEPRLVKIAGDDESIDVQQLTKADLAGGTDVRVERGNGLPEGKAAKVALITDWMKNGFIPIDVGMKALEMGTLGKVYKILQVDEDQATRENIAMKQLEVPPAVDPMMDDPMGGDGTGLPPAPDADPFGGLGAEDLPEGATLPAAVDNPMAEGPAAVGDPLAEQVDPATGQPLPPDPMSMAQQFPINSYDNDQVHVAVHQRFMKSQAYQELPDENKQVFEEHVAAHQQRMSNLTAQQMQAQAVQAGADLQAEKTPAAAGVPQGSDSPAPQ